MQLVLRWETPACHCRGAANAIAVSINSQAAISNWPLCAHRGRVIRHVVVRSVPRHLRVVEDSDEDATEKLHFYLKIITNVLVLLVRLCCMPFTGRQSPPAGT